MRQPTRVLVFGMTENPGGVESAIMNYYRYIDRCKIRFDFLCNTKKKIAYEDEIRGNGDSIFKITARSRNIKKYKRELDEFFRKNAKNYEAIWVNVSSLANIDYLKYAKKYGIQKRIIHSHNSKNMDSLLRGLLHRINKMRIEKYATDFWACSRQAEEWFYSKRNKRRKDCVIVNNAVAIDKYMFDGARREKVRVEMGVNEDTIVMGNVGRLHFQKNQEFALDVFAEALKKTLNMEFWLIGDGPDRMKLVNRANELKIADKIRFLGVRDDVQDLFQAMDVLVFPSKFEGLPYALIEAQYSGLLIYTSNNIDELAVKISPRIYFLSLEDGPKKWAEEIMKHINIKCRNVKITTNAYDIKNEAKKIERLLLS